MRKLIAIALIAIASFASLAAFANRGNGGAVRGAAARAGMMAAVVNPTAADYVQDGLIAMWDGIENAGWGVHNSSASTWKDLSGNGYDLSIVNGVWDSKSLTISGGRLYRSAIPTAMYTTEMLWVPKYVGNWWCNAFLQNSPNRYYYCSATNIVCVGEKHAIKSSSTVINKTSYMAAVYGSVFVGYLNGNVATASVSHNASATPVNFVNCNSNTGNGKFYAIRFYNRALTAVEIAHNYEVDKRRFNLP